MLLDLIRTLILDAFEKILEYNGYDDVELYFKTLQPLEFTNLDNAITEEEIEQQTGQKTGILRNRHRNRRRYIMAKALFIKRDDITKNTSLSGSVDSNKFLQFVQIAQEIHVQNLIGTSLYEKIETLILDGNGVYT